MRIRKLLIWSYIVVAWTLIGNVVLSAIGADVANWALDIGRAIDKARRDPLMTYTTASAPTLAALHQFTFMSAIYAFIGIAGAVLIGTLLYRSVDRGCLALREAALHFGKGDFTHRITYSGKNELGEVACAFNAMAEQLAAAQAETRKQ